MKSMRTRHTLHALLAVCAILAVWALPLRSYAAESAMEGWKEDSPAMQSIVEFVEAAADEDAEGFIPKEDRIAVFDMDGTLYGERFPTYFNDWLFIQRALYDESYEAPEELKEFAMAWEDKVLRGIPIEDFDAKERELGPQLYEGLTPDEYMDVVRRFKELPAWGFEDMTYGEAFFQPMVSLVQYLNEHDFNIYIVSATYRDAVRVMTEGVLDMYIPRDHVIGTDVLYVASGDEKEDNMFYELTPEDELVIAGRLFLKNQKTNKAALIQREIGRRPVLAFGNSTGDFSMATYTLQNETYGGRAYMLLCDDTERDYGDLEVAEAFREKCDQNGFYTVSEKDEFETLYTGTRIAEAPKAAPRMAAEADVENYQLGQLVVLSRHNIRAPLSNSGSAVAALTPHVWTKWTAKESELTLKGGIGETLMGQYFRKWLEEEELIPENYIPEAGEVRFYANARQRTIATARYFASGMLPLADTKIIYKGKLGSTDPVFKPVFTFMSDAYLDAVEEELEELFGLPEEGDLADRLAEDYALLSEVIDYEQSDGYKSGEYEAWETEDTRLLLEEGKEPAITGSLKTAMAASDALILQYYETEDAKEAAFGHDLSEEEWTRIADVNTIHQMLRYGSPLVGINTAHPMLEEIMRELENPRRKFSFLCGHDSNIATVLSALGVTDYELPGTIETRVPIGCKLLFERWVSEDGEEYGRVRLVYQSTDQLRSSEALTLDNPPMSYEIRLPELEANEDGLYRMEDLESYLYEAIDSYDLLEELYKEEAEELEQAS